MFRDIDNRKKGSFLKVVDGEYVPHTKKIFAITNSLPKDDPNYPSNWVMTHVPTGYAIQLHGTGSFADKMKRARLFYSSLSLPEKFSVDDYRVIIKDPELCKECSRIQRALYECKHLSKFQQHFNPLGLE
jgi:hypothetical protein